MTPEMLEKARAEKAAFKWLCEQSGPIGVATFPALLSRYAQSAVRDAVRLVEQHREYFKSKAACDAVCAALRQKFEVSE